MIENAIEVVGELASTGELVGTVSMGANAGTTNYERLNNKPKINGVELLGNVSLDALGIDIPDLPTNVSAFNNDAGYLTEVPSGYATEEYVDNATSNIVTSYNDLTDIPCGTMLEITKTIIPKDTYNSGQAYVPDSYEFLTEGAEYTVIYNGTIYKCISEWKMLTDGKEGLGFGNDSLYSNNGTDTGEAFSIIADDWDECFRINFKDADQGEIELHLANTTIKQIDPKYIPSEYVTEETMNNALTEKNDNPVLEFYFGDYCYFMGETSEGTGYIGMDETYPLSDLLPSLDTLINNYIKGKGGVLQTRSYYEPNMEFVVTSVNTNNVDNATAYLSSFVPFEIEADYSIKGKEYKRGILYTAYIYVTGTYSETEGFRSNYFEIKGDSSGYQVLTKFNRVEYTPTYDYHPATKKYVDDAINEAIRTALEASY